MIRMAAQPDEMMGWMESLADPTRLRLLRLLERDELGVGELCDVLQLPQSTVSRHLKFLTDHGWTHCRRQGTTNLYRLTVDQMQPSGKRLWQLAREMTDRWSTADQDRLRLARRLRAREEQTQAFFADAAGRWDKLRVDLYGQGFTTAALGAMLPSCWTVADLGCGTGQMTAELAGHVERVIGVDQSPAMLRAARKRTAGMKNVELRRGSIEAVPVDDASCDAALLVLVLTYLERPTAALAEACRVLRPGGKLVMIDLLQHDRDDFRRQMGQQSLGFGLDQMRRMLTEAGLASARCAALPPEPNVKGPALMLGAAVRPGKGPEGRR